MLKAHRLREGHDDLSEDMVQSRPLVDRLEHVDEVEGEGGDEEEEVDARVPLAKVADLRELVRLRHFPVSRPTVVISLHDLIGRAAFL